MENFESKKSRVYQPKNLHEDAESTIDLDTIHLAEIEIDEDIVLAVHRC